MTSPLLTVSSPCRQPGPGRGYRGEAAVEGLETNAGRGSRGRAEAPWRRPPEGRRGLPYEEEMDVRLSPARGQGERGWWA